MQVAIQTGLLTFNAFGIITITPKKIMVNITSVSGEHAIRRSISKDLRKPLPEIGEQTVAASFGAWIEPNRKTRLTVAEVGSLHITQPMIDIPEVNRIVEQAIQLIQQSAFH